jgi:hypothetical protein
MSLLVSDFFLYGPQQIPPPWGDDRKLAIDEQMFNLGFIPNEVPHVGFFFLFLSHNILNSKRFDMMRIANAIIGTVRHWHGPNHFAEDGNLSEFGKKLKVSLHILFRLAASDMHLPYIWFLLTLLSRRLSKPPAVIAKLRGSLDLVRNKNLKRPSY